MRCRNLTKVAGRIQVHMELEESKPNKPNFALVALLAACALIVVIIFAAVVVYWRAERVKKPPYAKHPVSQLSLPADSIQRA